MANYAFYFGQIKEELNAELVTVNDAYGDGRHVR